MSDEMNFDNAPKGEITSDDKMWAAIALALPVLGSLIALLLEDKKARPFIKHAAVHGLSLGAIMFILGLIPVVQCISPFIWIYALYLAYQSFNGEWATIPVVTDFAKGQGWL